MTKQVGTHHVRPNVSEVCEIQVCENAKVGIQEFEEDSTDVGSGVSDAESTGSSVYIPSGGAKKLKPNSVLSTAPKGEVLSAGKKARRRPVPKSLCLGAEGYFSGTPLEPIPGSPPVSPQKRKAILLAQAAAARRPCKADEAMPNGFRPPPGLSPPRRPPGQLGLPDRPKTVPTMVFTYEPPAPTQNSTSLGTSSSLPVLPYGSAMDGAPVASPKRYARDRMLAKAKHESMPVKVVLPELAASCAKMLDPTLPVKKKPAFADSLGDAANMSMHKLEPGIPAKKRVSTFLFTEPPQVTKAELTKVQPR